MGSIVKNTVKNIAGKGLALLAAALLISGCGKQFRPDREYGSAAAKDDNLIIVGVSQVGSESVWRTTNTESIQQAFTKENGYFLIFDNARQKQENQIKALRSFISQQVDYIVLSPITEEGWDTVLQEARDAGIPVILMDRQVNTDDESLYTAWVGSDFTEEGKKAGEWLADHLAVNQRTQERINIVVLQGTAGSTSEIGRTKGFNRIAAKYPNWHILEQVDAEFTTAKGREEMKKLLDKYTDIDVLLSQNDDMTFGALEAIQEAGITAGADGDILVISFDAVKPGLKLVQEGLINVDVECNANLGPDIDKIIKAIEKGEPVDKTNYVKERVFTRKNVSSVLDGSDD